MALFNFGKRKKHQVTNFKDGVEVSSKEKQLKEYGVQGEKGSYDWGQILGIGNGNPDDISIGTYKEMMKDAEVKTAYNVIVNCIESRRWRITFPEKTAKGNNKDILGFLRHAFTSLDDNTQFEKSVSKLLTAIVYGFSTVEIVYKLLKEGKYKGKIGLKRLKDLDPEKIVFDCNKYGDIEKILQSRDEGLKPIKLPLDRTIIYSIDKEFGNHYGTSRLRSVYMNWFVKKTVIKFWNIALERFGMPLLIGTVPSKQELDRMLSILNNVQTKSSLAKTQGWEIEALETGIGRSAGGDYKDAISYHNNQIVRAMLVPPLLISSGAGGGSYALSNTQFGIFQNMLKSLEVDLSAIIEEKIIKPLVIFNFGPQDVYPQFVYEPMTKEDLLNLSKVFALLVKNGIVGYDEEWMRDMMGVPHRDVAEVSRDTVKDKATDDGKSTGVKTPQARIERTTIDKTPGATKGGSQQVKTPKSPVAGKKVGAAGGDKTPV